MTSDSFMLLFDIIILCYGLYLVYSGFQMKKTHQPSNLIINQADVIGARDAKSFCEAMFKPTVIFGAVSALYGVVGFINDRYLGQWWLNIAGIVLFLVMCFWFLRVTKKNREKYLK